MSSEVLNNSFGPQYSFGLPKISEEQEIEIIAGLFEQLMLFDKIIISTSRSNLALILLIKNIGINAVERLLDNNYIKFLLWTPVIVTGIGHQNDDGSMDESVIYGKPPIVAGSLSNEDIDPEKNINNALSHFTLHRDRKRIFIKRASSRYLIPDGMLYSGDSAKYVIDSYKNNDLADIGLPYDKEPDQLDLKQRMNLLDLGHKVLETAILANYNFKSFNNFEHYKIFENNVNSIGKAFKITENATEILRIENIPNFKNLYIQNRLNFESVFRLRHLSNAKYFRKWINSINENYNANEITSEYLKEVKGNSNFFNTNEGRFIRNLGIFGASLALGAAIASPAIDLGLGLLDTYILDKLLKGNNPSMFIDNLKNEIKRDENAL